MTVRLLLSVLLALGLGCGRQPASAPATVTSPATAAAETDTSAMDAAQVLQDLTQAVRKFGVEQQRAPKSLDDLVTQGYLTSIPPAPAGKRFAINKQLQVYLAER